MNLKQSDNKISLPLAKLFCIQYKCQCKREHYIGYYSLHATQRTVPFKHAERQPERNKIDEA